MLFCVLAPWVKNKCKLIPLLKIEHYNDTLHQNILTESTSNLEGVGGYELKTTKYCFSQTNMAMWESSFGKVGVWLKGKGKAREEMEFKVG